MLTQIAASISQAGWLVASYFGLALCSLCVLCASVMKERREITHHRVTENTEITQRRVAAIVQGIRFWTATKNVR